MITKPLETLFKRGNHLNAQLKITDITTTFSIDEFFLAGGTIIAINIP